MPATSSTRTASADESSVAVSGLQLLANVSRFDEGQDASQLSTTMVSRTSSIPTTPERPPRSINISSPTPNSSNVTPLFDPNFIELKISAIDWEERIQETGCTMKDDMPKKTYNKKQIPTFGPNKVYYYHLCSIAIDYIEYFKNNQKDWNRLPKNVTNLKTKILGMLLTFRKRMDNGRYKLDQEMFINLLFENWGGVHAVSQIVDNDKLRVFGLLLTKEKNKYILERLAEGIKNRNQLDDSMYSLKEMFQTLVLDYNNEEVVVDLPTDAEELDDYMSLDANDISRIKVLRDC